MTAEDAAPMGDETIRRWPWTPTALIGIAIETVRRVVLADLEDMRRAGIPREVK